MATHSKTYIRLTTYRFESCPGDNFNNNNNNTAQHGK